MINSQWVEVAKNSDQVDAGKPERVVVASYNPNALLVGIRPYDDDKAAIKKMTLHKFFKGFDLADSNNVAITPSRSVWESIYVNNMNVKVTGTKWGGQVVTFRQTTKKKGPPDPQLSIKRFLSHFRPRIKK